MSHRPNAAFVALLAGTALSLFLSAAAAQSYPNKPIHVIVPYPAGGAVDAMARVFAQKFNEALGQPVIVENRAGAGGNIGAEVVAKSPPDGYTWLINTSGQAIAPGLYRRLNYDAVKDLTPVTQFVTTSLVLVVPPQLGVNSPRELIARAKAQPGKLNYGSTGIGSAPNLVGEMLRVGTVINIIHVPYKGDAQLFPALFTNEVQLAFVPPQTGLAHIKAGKIKALATTGLARMSSLPDVPTMTESGVPEVQYNGWVGLFMPGGTPRDIADKISGETSKVLRMPDVAKYYPAWGVEPVGNTPDAFGAIYHSEIERFTKLIREAKIPQVD